ncbi:hypothetical protein [Actinomadura sp. 21ATH]|uniref:effector-associated domain 2-containing protein n=1 Tax=Actinomadura sp. 21ATH TaxID=1735444 RepID=UPI0035C24CA1
MPVPAAEGWRPSGLCTIFVCDIASFGDAGRTDEARTHVRRAMYAALEAAFAVPGAVPLGECHVEDRGDGAMVIMPPHADRATCVTEVAAMLLARLRVHNGVSNEAARLRLRTALHTGEAHWDGTGVVGDAVNHAFRILDAPAFKEVMRASGAQLGLAVSEAVYGDVVRHGRGAVDPEDYRRIGVEVKETRAAAWVTLPGRGLPPPEPPAEPGGVLMATPPGAVVAPPPWWEAPVEGRAGSGAVPSGDVLFELVEHALAIPQMTAERSRERVVNALPLQIRSVIPRSFDARSDTYEIIRTCLDYPGGLQELLRALRGFAGDSLALGRLERAIAQLLLGPDGP